MIFRLGGLKSALLIFNEIIVGLDNKHFFRSFGNKLLSGFFDGDDRELI